MNSRLTARDRLARLLSVIPWVTEQNDGALIDDIVTRFDYPRKQLLDDLQEVVFFVGVHPFTPDSMIEVEIHEERVRIRYADWFSRPLRLSPIEVARLLTAGRSVLSSGGTLDSDDEAAGPLLRALTKLGAALGDAADTALEVRLGAAPETTLDLVRQALRESRPVDLEYYTYGRDELTVRKVDPHRLFSDNGNWYLSGWCHRADGERVFRVDRIREANLAEGHVSSDAGQSAGAFTPAGDDPRVTIRIPSGAQWVIEQYPHEGIVGGPDGSVDVRMAITALPWLERLLLRLGPEAELIAADGPLELDLRSSAAARVLARYQ